MARACTASSLRTVRIGPDEIAQPRVRVRGDIEDPRLGVERPTVPVPATRRAGKRERTPGVSRSRHRRRREHRPEHVGLDDLERLGAQLRREVDQIVDGKPLTVERRRLGREGLCRPRLLPRRRGRRHRPLFNRPHRLPRHAVKHEQEAVLGDLHHRLDGLPSDGDVAEHGRRRQVVVPQVMMHELVVPHPLAGPGVEAHKAVAVEILSWPVPHRRRRAPETTGADRGSRARHPQ